MAQTYESLTLEAASAVAAQNATKTSPEKSSVNQDAKFEACVVDAVKANATDPKEVEVYKGDKAGEFDSFTVIGVHDKSNQGHNVMYGPEVHINKEKNHMAIFFKDDSKDENDNGATHTMAVVQADPRNVQAPGRLNRIRDEGDKVTDAQKQDVENKARGILNQIRTCMKPSSP